MIRPATDADLSALGRLGALLMRSHHAFDRQRFLPPGRHPEIGYAKFLATQLERRDVTILVAEVEGTVLGYVYAGIEPLSWKELRDEAGFIHDVVVDDRNRRADIATALIGAAVEWLRRHSAQRVMLWTAEANSDAQRLFAH